MKIEHNSHSEFYRSPFGAVTCGSTVKLRIGIADGGLPDYVRVHYNLKDEKYFINMSYLLQVGEYCVYEAELSIPNRTGLLWYYFEISNRAGRTYYANNEKQLGGIGQIYPQLPVIPYQITIYDSSYTTPDWFKNSVVYQIFPDRFFNGNENGEHSGNRDDVIKRNWGDTPFYKAEQFGGEYKANDFFGGNLKGITKKLIYLAELGIGAIYLNPVFKAYSNHKYDTGNYMQIDESFGTYEDFCELCKKAEELDIKIILDGVFNHTGSNSIYFNKNGEYDSLGAYQSQSSPYYSWYNFKSYPDEYESWWGMKTLPSVNESSPEYQNYIIKDENSVIKHWLKSGAGGWRLDVADELPGFFIKELRKAAKSVDKDAVIIGEVWEDASNKESYGEQREYFLGEELDSVMNYPLRNALVDLAKKNINAEEFNQRIMSLKENYPYPAYYSLLNLLSSHDIERIITAVSNAPATNNKDFMAQYRLDEEQYRLAVKKVKQIVMMLMLMPGVPCVYYGDEIGMYGYRDPFCRGCYTWDRTDEDLRLWYKMSIALRKSSPAFVEGEFEAVYKVNYGYAFIRYLNSDKHIVCANFSENTEWFRLDLARFGIHEINDEIYESTYTSEDGIYYIEMPPGEIKVFNGFY